MNRQLKVGITGGIGAGKTIVSNVFRILGVPIYDADQEAKRLMSESASLKSAIKVLFGDESFVDDSLNRQHIASKAFNEPKLLSQLNQLVHPVVQEDFQDWLNRQDNPAYILKEAAIMFETGSHLLLDQVILVSAEQETRIKRVLKRDSHRTREDVMAIISRQMPEVEKENLADLILRNDETELLLPQILKLHEEFSGKS